NVDIYQSKTSPNKLCVVQRFEGVLNGAGNWVTAFPKLASKTSAWAHLELVFEGVDDYVRVLSKNGDEVAKVFKNGQMKFLKYLTTFLEQHQQTQQHQ
ncbi:MAG: hypothetical protein K2W79_12970, partial [Hydrotalea flava]|nr:hypothetical protein [Hydrotalea flava]